MKVRLYDYIPRGEVWFVPQELQEPATGESVEAWCSRLVAAAQAGRVAIVRNCEEAING